MYATFNWLQNIDPLIDLYVALFHLNTGTIFPNQKVLILYEIQAKTVFKLTYMCTYILPYCISELYIHVYQSTA